MNNMLLYHKQYEVFFHACLKGAFRMQGRIGDFIVEQPMVIGHESAGYGPSICSVMPMQAHQAGRANMLSVRRLLQPSVLSPCLLITFRGS